jgi:hypothetical protein
VRKIAKSKPRDRTNRAAQDGPRAHMRGPRPTGDVVQKDGRQIPIGTMIQWIVE